MSDEKIEVGSIVEGKVVKTKPFGAIVSLHNNCQGLVHISHISRSFVQNIGDHLSVGDIVKVKVLSVDPVSGKISLSIKEAAEPPKKPDAEPRPHSTEGWHKRQPQDASSPTNSFEEKFKEWLKASNERQAGLNKRNKRR